MQRTQSFMKNMIPLAAVTALVVGGPLVTSGFGGPATLAEGGKASLLACRAADASLTAACDLLDQRSLAFWPQIEAGHAQVQDALAASKGAAWGKALRRDRRTVVRLLAIANRRLDRCERPSIAGRFATVKNYADAARARIARAALLLEDVVPPELPDLTRRPSDPAAPIDPPTLSPDFAWTEFTPSADTKIYYVSDSTGNDANDGLSPEKALKTPQVAYGKLRNGYPDWMLLKRGDVWDGTGTTYAFVSEGDRSGRSAAEPIVIGTYGTSNTRPKMIDGRFRGLDGMSHVAMTGLDFVLSGKKAILSFAISMGGASCSDVLIEDCRFDGYPGNIQVDGQDKRLADIRIRGCVVMNAVGQGILASDIDRLLIEGCVFDQNGWREGDTTRPASGFNHNMYLQGDNTDVTVRNTITARASSHGMSLSAGGVSEDNLCLQNPISIAAHKNCKIRGNVVLDSRDISGEYRGHGIWVNEFQNMEVSDNIVAHQVNGTQPRGLEFDVDSSNNSLDVHDNIVYKWDGAAPNLTPIGLYFSTRLYGTVKISDNTFHMAGGKVLELDFPYVTGSVQFSGNRYYSTAGTNHWFYVEGDLAGGINEWKSLTGESNAVGTPASYPDPERTIATYSASLGKGASLDAFMAEATKQSRLNWRLEYTAKVANNYFRAGFGLSPR